MIAICTVMETEDGKKYVSLEDYQKLLEKYEGEVGYETNEEIIARAGEDEIPEDKSQYDGCVGCAYEKEPETGRHCIKCKRNRATDMYKRKTNYDLCCESLENMAQVIDMAKIGWTKEQITDWLRQRA